MAFLSFEVWVKDFKAFDLIFGYPMKNYLCCTPCKYERPKKVMNIHRCFSNLRSVNLGFPEVAGGPWGFRRVQRSNTIPKNSLKFILGKQEIANTPYSMSREHFCFFGHSSLCHNAFLTKIGGRLPLSVLDLNQNVWDQTGGKPQFQGQHFRAHPPPNPHHYQLFSVSVPYSMKTVKPPRRGGGGVGWGWGIDYSSSREQIRYFIVPVSSKLVKFWNIVEQK